MKAVLVASVLLVSTSVAWADAGVPPVWTDFQPAISTQCCPPDGGRTYPKPNTAQIQRAGSRVTPDLPSAIPADRPNRPLAPLPPLPPASPTDPSTKPPSQVGR